MLNQEIRIRGSEVIARQEQKYSYRKIFSERDKAWVSGVIEKEFEFSHSVKDENYYQTRVKVKRLSDNYDYVPILVSEFVLPKEFDNVKGKYIEVGGEFRSLGYHGEDGKNHLKLFVFGKIVNICDCKEELIEDFNVNILFLQGYVCKQAVFRKTSLNKEITDTMVAINRKAGKSFFAPCISWGKNAILLKDLSIGQKVELYGRFQSRQYLKKEADTPGEGDLKTAYEVSVIKFKPLEKYA